MKALSPPGKIRRVPLHKQREETFTEQVFEVEASDVGQSWPHHGEYNHGWYRIQASDVGRSFRRCWQGRHYECWDFTA